MEGMDSCHPNTDLISQLGNRIQLQSRQHHLLPAVSSRTATRTATRATSVAGVHWRFGVCGGCIHFPSRSDILCPLFLCISHSLRKSVPPSEMKTGLRGGWGAQLF